MAENSKIEWTDASWNPTRGCDGISPGCDNCYAEKFAERWRGIPGHPYEQGFDFRLAPHLMTEPLKWQASKNIFVNSMSDLFHRKVSFDYIAAVYAVMGLADWHSFQILTKRPHRAAEFDRWIKSKQSDLLPREELDWNIYHMVAADEFVNHPRYVKLLRQREDYFAPEYPLPNVQLGVSVEHPDFKGRIDELRTIDAATRFLSLEPLLADLGELDLRGIDWVIIGGESGNGARPFDPKWARNILKQCRAARVPVFMKQMGSNPVGLQLQDKKGGDPDEWPAGLRVRRLPPAAVSR